MRRLAVALTLAWLGTLSLARADDASDRAAAESSLPAEEQTSSEQRAMAEMLFFAARGLMEAERYAEACTKLAESYRLDPASGTLLNLAVCHEHEGKIASAWGEFRKAIAEAKRAGRSDREELARAHAEALEPQLPFLVLDVPTAARVPGLTIVRNGVTIQQAGWATALPVDPGEVEVELSAPGHAPRTEHVSIARGQHLIMTVGPLAAEARIAARENHPATTYWTARRKTGLGLVLASALSLGTGVGAGVHALSQRDASDRACPKLDGERRCSQAGADAMSSARGWALVSDLTLGAGLISVAVGTYLLATGAEARAPARGHEKAALDSRSLRAASRWSFEVSASPRGARGWLGRSF